MNKNLSYTSYISRDMACLCSLRLADKTLEYIETIAKLLKYTYAQGLLQLFAISVYRAASKKKDCSHIEFKNILETFPELLISLQNFEKLNSEHYPIEDAEQFVNKASFNELSNFLVISLHFFDEFSRPANLWEWYKNTKIETNKH